jgi:hypothetical protein
MLRLLWSNSDVKINVIIQLLYAELLITKNPAKFFTAIYDWPVTLLSAFLESRKLAAPLNPS